MVNGHIEHIPVGVFQQQVFPLHAANVPHHESLEAANAIFQMHHKIPGLNVGKVRFRGGGGGLPPAARRRPFPAKYLRIGEQVEQHPVVLPVDQREPFQQGAVDEGDQVFRCQVFPCSSTPLLLRSSAHQALRGAVFLLPQVGQAGGLAADDDGALAVVLGALQLGQQRPHLPAVAGAGIKC